MPWSTYREVCSDGHQCCLLAVDDDEEILDILKEIFALQKNINLLTATTKAEAVRIIHETPELEAILLDLRLDCDDPRETLRDVVVAADNRIAVIAISGSHELENMAKDNGAADFWGKPLTEIDIIGRSKFAISNQRKINYWRDKCHHYEGRLRVIEDEVPTNPEKALEELEITRLELKADVQALMMRAS